MVRSHYKLEVLPVSLVDGYVEVCILEVKRCKPVWILKSCNDGGKRYLPEPEVVYEFESSQVLNRMETLQKKELWGVESSSCFLKEPPLSLIDQVMRPFLFAKSSREQGP